MTKKYCDKCGKEINTYPGMNAIFPKYKITYIQGINLNCEIDLCSECNSSLGQWLKTKPENQINKEELKENNLFRNLLVRHTESGPYYEIEYFDKKDNKVHIGYSSYKLDVISDYLRKYFSFSESEGEGDING